MTDRIQSGFELWAQKQGFTDLTMHMGRYNRAVVRWMWAAWLEQSERITDMAAALDRSHKRSTELLRQCRDHDTRRAAAVQQAQALCAGEFFGMPYSFEGIGKAVRRELERHRWDSHPTDHPLRGVSG